jgi:hypothetical protein
MNVPEECSVCHEGRLALLETEKREEYLDGVGMPNDPNRIPAAAMRRTVPPGCCHAADGARADLGDVRTVRPSSARMSDAQWCPTCGGSRDARLLFCADPFHRDSPGDDPDA